MDQRLALEKLIRDSETAKRQAEEAEQAAAEAVQRWKDKRAEAERALEAFNFTLDALRRAGGQEAPEERAAEPSLPPDQPPPPPPQAKSRRPVARRSRRKRSKKPTAAEHILSLLGPDEMLSVGDMRRRLKEQGLEVAAQTLEYGVKTLIEKGIVIPRTAPPGSAAKTVYVLSGGDKRQSAEPVEQSNLSRSVVS
jgi:hypothetical protein